MTSTPTQTFSWSTTFSETPTLPGTYTNSPTRTPTGSFTGSPTPSQSNTESYTFTGTVTFTDSPTVTESATETPSFTESATATDSATETLTKTPSPTRTASKSPTTTRTVTLTRTLTRTFSVSPTLSDKTVVFEIKAIYPNPISDHGYIYYTLEHEAQMELTIYNVAGEPIWKYEVTGQQGKNTILWKGLNDWTSRVASGIYVIRLKATGLEGSEGLVRWATVCVAR